MNSTAPRVLLVAAPVTALVLFWLWRRRRQQNGARSCASPSSSASSAGRGSGIGGASRNQAKITVQVEVPDYAMGLVIGRRGQNIRQIESDTGARVHMCDIPDSSGGRAEIFGFPDQVAQAEPLVQQSVRDAARKLEESKKSVTSVEVVVPGPAVGRVIGRRGQTIRNIERMTKARLRLEQRNSPKEEDHACVITGTDEQTAAAAAMVRDEVAQEAIDRKARSLGPRRVGGEDLPTSGPSQRGLEPVEVDWSALASRLPDSSDDGLQVFVSASCHPHCFWVQVISDEAGKLEELSQEMNDCYSSLRRREMLLSRVKVGDVCAAQFADDEKWYRGRIMSIREDEVDIFFLDFGDSQFIDRQDIKALKPEYLELPFQAVLCSLAGISPFDGSNQWSSAACDCLLELTLAGEWAPMILQVKSLPSGSRPVDTSSLYPEPTMVELVDTSSDVDVYVAKTLLEYSHAIPSAAAAAVATSQSMDQDSSGAACASAQPQGTPTASSTSTEDEDEIEKTEADVSLSNGFGFGGHGRVKDGIKCARLPASAYGGMVQVRVSAVRDPSLFWVQLNSGLDQLETLSDQLTDDYSKLDSDEMVLEDLEKGMVCCAMFGHDETWYRAVIVSLPEGDGDYCAVVQYLDYADTAKVRPGNIKQLREEYKELPFQAIALQMANITSTNGTWGQDAIEKFELLTHVGSWQSSLVNLVAPARPGVVPKVELFTMVAEGESVSEIMVKEGLAVWAACGTTRHSLDSEPSLLVEEALAQVEEEDLKETTKTLPVLARATSNPVASAKLKA